MEYEILHPSQHWLGRMCPVECSPVGYAYLIERFELRVPVPLRLFGIGTKQRKRQDWDFDGYTGWTVLEPRYWPKHGLRGQLTFALKYEGVDLAVLKKLFTEVQEVKGEIEAWVNEQPKSQYARYTWFYFEALTGSELEVEALSRSTLPLETPHDYISISEHLHRPDQVQTRSDDHFSTAMQLYWESTGMEQYGPRTRSRVLQSASFNPKFVPVVRRTPTIDAYLARDWVAEAEAMTARPAFQSKVKNQQRTRTRPGRRLLAKPFRGATRTC